MEFKRGMLYVRMTNGNPKFFCYPNKDVWEGYYNFGFCSIARIAEHTANPSFVHMIETVHHGEYLFGGLITFRMATDDDIRSLLLLLAENPWFLWHEWKQVLSRDATNLLEEEKSRIARIAEEMGF